MNGSPPSLFLDRHYDLADMLVRFHIPVRLNDLAQRKCLSDTRLEIALLELVEDVFFRLRPGRRNRDNLEYRVPTHRQTLWKSNQQRKRSRFHRQAAIFVDRSALRGCLAEQLDALAPDWIEHHSCSLAACNLSYAFHQILFLSGNHVVRAQRQ